MNKDNKEILDRLDSKDLSYVALARSLVLIALPLAVIAVVGDYQFLMGTCIGTISVCFGLLIQIHSNNKEK